MRSPLYSIILLILAFNAAFFPAAARADTSPSVLVAGDTYTLWLVTQHQGKFHLLFRGPGMPAGVLHPAIDADGTVVNIAASQGAAYLLYDNQFIQRITYINTTDAALNANRFNVDQLPALPADTHMLDFAAGSGDPYLLALAPPPTHKPPVDIFGTDDDTDLFTSKPAPAAPTPPKNATAQAAPDKPAESPAPDSADATGAAPQLTVFRFSQGRWQPITAPTDLDPSSQMRLIVINHQPVILHRDGEALIVYRYDGTTWSSTSDTMHLSDAYRPVSVAGHLLLIDRTSNAAGDGLQLQTRLWFDGKWLDAGRMDLPAGHRVDDLPTGYDDQLTVILAAPSDQAGGSPQLSWLGRDLNNAPDSAPVSGKLKIEQWPTPPLSRDMMVFVMVAVAMLIMMAVWRRDAQSNMVKLPRGVVPAELTRRGMALLIDLLPAWGALYLIQGLTQVEQLFKHLLTYGDWSQWVISLIVVLLMTVHVTLSEMFTGRSLGKWIMGIRVVTITGGPPNVWQILARNAIRVLELPPLVWPLVMIVALNASHQRLGDMAGRTVVVRNARPGEPATSTDRSRSGRNKPTNHDE